MLEIILSVIAVQVWLGISIWTMDLRLRGGELLIEIILSTIFMPAVLTAFLCRKFLGDFSQ